MTHQRTANDKSHEYLKVKIETAKPTELLLLLLDGAVKFTRQARARIEEKDFEEKNRLLLKAQDIMLELIQALDPTIGEELYSRLVGLYRFCYERLVRANLDNDTGPADEALSILEHLRETWRLAIRKFEEEEKENGPHAARPEHVLCLEG